MHEHRIYLFKFILSLSLLCRERASLPALDIVFFIIALRLNNLKTVHGRAHVPRYALLDKDDGTQTPEIGKEETEDGGKR